MSNRLAAAVRRLLYSTDLAPRPRADRWRYTQPPTADRRRGTSCRGAGAGASFTNYHRVSNRNSWSSRRIAGRLLQLLVGTFVPDGPVIVGLDDTLERRWGSKIKARGIYRDPVLRQSQRTALALCDAAAAYSLDWPRLEFAIPDCLGSLRAIRATTAAATDETHRLGSIDLAADRAMAARAADHRRH